MTIEHIDAEDGISLILGGAAELADAAGLRDALIECLQSRRSVELNLEGLTEVDLPTLQLVVAAQRSFAAAQVPLSLRAQGVFSHACRATGLDILGPGASV